MICRSAGLWNAASWHIIARANARDLLHVADKRQARKALQPNHFGHVIDVLLLDQELAQRVTGRRLDLRSLGESSASRSVIASFTLPMPTRTTRELVAARGAFPHPHRPGHTPTNLLRLPMEMRAMLQLLAALHLDLVADIVKVGELGAARYSVSSPHDIFCAAPRPRNSMPTMPISIMTPKMPKPESRSCAYPRRTSRR